MSTLRLDERALERACADGPIIGILLLLYLTTGRVTAHLPGLLWASTLVTLVSLAAGRLFIRRVSGSPATTILAVAAAVGGYLMGTNPPLLAVPIFANTAAVVVALAAVDPRNRG